MAFRHAHRDMPAARMAKERHGALAERPDKGGDVGDMGVDPEIPAVRRPGPRPAMAHGQRHHMQARCGQGLHLCGKAPLIAQRAVDHQQRLPTDTGFCIVELGPVDVHASHGVPPYADVRPIVGRDNAAAKAGGSARLLNQRGQNGSEVAVLHERRTGRPLRSQRNQLATASRRRYRKTVMGRT